MHLLTQMVEKFSARVTVRYRSGAIDSCSCFFLPNIDQLYLIMVIVISRMTNSIIVLMCHFDSNIKIEQI